LSSTPISRLPVAENFKNYISELRKENLELQKVNKQLASENAQIAAQLRLSLEFQVCAIVCFLKKKWN